MDYAGYAHLLTIAPIHALEPAVVAEIRAVTRKEVIGNTIAVNRAMAPEDSDILGQVLFALKHEGVNLQILSQALPLILEADIRAAFEHSPNSQFIRRACYLWEYFTGQRIQSDIEIRQTYVPLFDPDAYITRPGEKSPRWRVTFNGLGSLGYCVTVRRTEELDEHLKKNLLKQASDFTESLPCELLQRTLAWAYLHETRDSYAIEKEIPSSDKATRFVNLLKQAHQKRLLDEDYLVDLQNAVISNPFSQAASFRTEQNYLSNGLRGALGVTYVPPDPALSRTLMDELMQLANDAPAVDPLVLASIVSFGFVFVHPFMDGNGRLSRFLFHQVLCQRGALNNGLLLPVSMVLRQTEAEYLAVLQAFSAKAREFWDVTYLDEARFAFDFKGHDAIYRYWDGTDCAEFMARATETALEQHLKAESLYLDRYDRIFRLIDQAYDVINSDLAQLVMFCLDQNGRVSQNRRRQYQHKVPEAVFDALEEAYRTVVSEDGQK